MDKKCMTTVICEIATLIAENGCDPEKLWPLGKEQSWAAQNLLAYIKAWAEIMLTDMPAVIPASPWAKAEKKCTMMTKESYDVGPNMAILAEVNKLLEIPDIKVVDC